jgi:hypothetical protein
MQVLQAIAYREYVRFIFNVAPFSRPGTQTVATHRGSVNISELGTAGTKSRALERRTNGVPPNKARGRGHAEVLQCFDRVMREQLEYASSTSSRRGR